jgi:DHA1 family inner membrane transport protein
MPLVLFVFFLCAFSLGFTEFVTVGLIPEMSSSLGATIAQVGWAVTAYALGVVIGAPVLTALTAGWSRRRVLVTALVVFALANAMTALSSHLAPLLLSRFIGGLCHGVFFAVAASVASRLVEPRRSGSALALVFGGVTVAMALGAPLGAWFGSLFDWRTIFLLVAVVGGLSGIGLGFAMRRGTDGAAPRSNQLRHLTNRHLLAGAVLPMTAFTGLFTFYTFVSPTLLTITRLDPAEASLLLLAFGAGAAFGNTVGGHLADRVDIDTVTAWSLGLVTLALFVLWMSDTHWLPTSVLLALLGFAGFGSVPPLQSRMLRLAKRHDPAAADIASGLNIAALNSGIAFGSLVGGVTIGFAGLRQAPGVAAFITAAALLMVLWQMRLSRKQPARWTTPSTS